MFKLSQESNMGDDDNELMTSLVKHRSGEKKRKVQLLTISKDSPVRR